MTLYAHNRESIFDFEVSPRVPLFVLYFSLRALLDERWKKEGKRTDTNGQHFIGITISLLFTEQFPFLLKYAHKCMNDDKRIVDDRFYELLEQK